MNSPAEAVTPVVESGGFTIVEEDDVAFSLGLSREIHRIYGSYQSGELEPSDSVHLGLALTVQMLGTLSASVTRGMPAMRIEVAWAQISEMMSVMFGEPVVRKTTRGGRPQLKASARPPVPLQDAGNQQSIPEIARPAGCEPSVPAEGTAVAGAAIPPAVPTDEVPGTGRSGGANPVLWQRWRSWVRHRPPVVRLILAAVACALAATLIDLPIAALLLFPEFSLQLAAAYAVAAGLIWWSVRRAIQDPSICA